MSSETVILTQMNRLKNINLQIQHHMNHVKTLKIQKREIELQIEELMLKSNKSTVINQGNTLEIHEKQVLKPKKKVEKEQAIANVLKKTGVSNVSYTLNEIMNAMQGEHQNKTKIVLKDDSNKKN